MEWFEYLAKASLVLSCLYLAYWLLFRYDTFHHLKRWVLLAGLVLSACLPLLRINAFQTPVAVDPSQAIAIPVEYWLLMRQSAANASPEQFSWQQIGLIAYGLVAGVLLLRLLANLIRLAVFLRRLHFQPLNQCALAESEKIKTPFSFFHFILLPQMADAELRQQILAHEHAHASHCHTVDVLLSELYLAFFWFNPVAWLYRRQLRLNLEHLADAVALQQANAYRYQLNLLRISTAATQFSLVNHFHFSSLKQRIRMMNRSHSPVHASLKYIVLPLMVTGLVSLFHMTKAHSVVEKAWLPLSEIVAENAVSDAESPAPLAVTPAKNSITEKQKTPTIRGIIKDVDTGEPIGGVAVYPVSRTYGMLSTEEGAFALNVGKEEKLIFEHPDYITPQLMQMAPDTPEKLTVWLKKRPARMANADASLEGPRQPIVFQDTSILGKVLYIVNGKKLSADEMKKLDPDQIESMTVSKGEQAMALYGEEGRNGVIHITMRNGYSGTSTPSVAPVTMLKYPAPANSSNPPPLYLVNGKEQTPDDIKKLDPETIASVNVIKDAAAQKKYGKKGENGVVEITLKSK
jgi:hypothetical protein